MLTLRAPLRLLATCALVVAVALGAAAPAAAQQTQQTATQQTATQQTSTQQTPSPPADQPRTVRLVQLPDGSLRVHRGAAYSAAAGERVLVEEVDVTLSPAVTPAGDLLDADTGLAADALRAEQWNLDLVAAETAWQATTGADQVIAVVDTGTDSRHEDLAGRVLPGWSVADAGDPDASSHGTHVAGIIAAVAGNDQGVAGLAPGAQVLPVQVMGAGGAVYASDVAAGLIWATEQGATVANLSLAGTQRSQVLDAAIDHAVANDVVVVVAAGNEYADGNPTTYPAAHPDVIAVGALRDATTRSAFSTTGDFVDLMAPGSSIVSTRPGDAYGYASGTSMAAPLVAAAAALVRSLDPDMTAAEVVALLTESARRIGDGGVDEEFGHGALDVVAALAAAGHQTAEPEPAPDDPATDPVPDRDPWARQPVFDRPALSSWFMRR